MCPAINNDFDYQQMKTRNFPIILALLQPLFYAAINITPDLISGGRLEYAVRTSDEEESATDSTDMKLIIQEFDQQLPPLVRQLQDIHRQCIANTDGKKPTDSREPLWFYSPGVT